MVPGRASRNVPATKILPTAHAAGSLAADRGYDNRSMKAQMKLANRSAATHAVIVGDEEVAAGTVIVKPMAGGEQQTIPRAELIARLQRTTRETQS